MRVWEHVADECDYITNFLGNAAISPMSAGIGTEVE